MEKTIKLFFCSLFSLMPFSLLFIQPALAEDMNYHIVKTITSLQQNIPPVNNGGHWCSDIAYFDQYNNRFYLADDNNKQVDVVDAQSNTLLNPITSSDFTGLQGCNNFDFSHEGPEGIVADNQGRLWVGNGNSTVEVFDTRTGAKLATINTQGTARADELAYDKKDNVVIVTNPDDASGPFYSLIDGSNYSLINNAKYLIPGAQSLEQPAWNPVDDKFYMAIPSVGAVGNSPALPGGEVAVIDPTNHSQPFVKADMIGDCGPSGLSFDVIRQEAALGCSNAAEVLNVQTGHIDTYNQITGVDEVWFNPGDRRWYFGSFGQQSLGVVSALTNSFVTNIPINDPNFHAAAADPYTNNIYVAESGKGIVVYHADK